MALKIFSSIRTYWFRKQTAPWHCSMTSSWLMQWSHLKSMPAASKTAFSVSTSLWSQSQIIILGLCSIAYVSFRQTAGFCSSA